MNPLKSIPPVKALSERGQALVELALLLPILLLLVVGSIEFGRAFYLKNRAINAAREGARAAVVAPNATYYSDAQTAVARLVSTAPPNKFDINPTTAPTTKGAPVQVTVKVRFNTIVPMFTSNWFRFANISSIRGSATMRYEGL